MENLSTRASSRRSSFDLRPKPQVNPKYKQIFSYQGSLGLRGYTPKQRLDANTHFIQSLQSQTNKKINRSYLFTPGKQEKNGRFAEVFVDFFRVLRGAGPLINSSGKSLASKFVTSPDMCKIHETSSVDEYGIDTTTTCSPTLQLIDELKQILEDEYGLQNQFLTVLNKNGKRFNDFAKLEDRDLFLATLPKDHPYRQKWGLQTAPVYIPLSMIAKLFPKCVEALKEVFNSLLITEWLKKDIDGVKLYLNETDYVDRPIQSLEEITLAVRLWETAKDYGEKQRKYDTEIEAKHWNEFQNDLWGTMVSGGLSICTLNPTPVIAKAAHTMMNVIGNQVDPEGKDKRVQVLKMFGGVGLGGVMGANPWDLGTSLGIDLVELAVRDQKTTKGESALLGLWGSVLKGVLTGDQKKLVCQILGGCVAEAAGQLPETDENTSLERRIARALLTNSDVQAHFIKGFVDKRFKDDRRPKTGGTLTPEEQEKYPKQVLTETDAGIHISEEEQKLTQTVMQDPEAFARLQKEREREAAKLPALEKTALADKKEYEKDHKDKRKYKGKWDGAKDPVSLSIYGIKHNAAKKACDKSKPKMEKSSQRLTDQNNKIEDIDRRIALASAPKEIKAPDLSMHRVFETTTKKHHHVYIVDSRGYKHSLGKYDSADDARLIASIFSRGETNTANHKLKCSEIQQAMLERGVSIENIPNIPEFKTPATHGNNFDKNYKVLQQVDIANRGDFQSFVNSAEQILGEKVETQGLSKTEINQISKQLTPKIKEIKQPSVIDKVGNAYDKTCHFLHKIGFSGEVTVGSMNLYEMKPSTVSDNHVPTYTPPPPQTSQHSSNMGQWEGVQQMQQAQMLEMNMAYRSPVDTSSQGNLDYQQFWGQGLNPNAQIPPSDWSGLGRNDPEHRIPGMKHYPDGDRTQSNIPKWLRYFASAGETIDPQERINRNTQSLVATAKVAGQAFGEIADELRSFGCVNAKFDQGKVTLRFDRTISSQIDGLMDQFLPNLDHVPNFRYVEFTARIANDIMLQAFMMPMFQAQKAKPLLDRVLVRPQGFGQQVRAIEAFQQPAWRSGLGFPKLGLMPGQNKLLTERTVLRLEGLEIKASRGINRSSNQQFITWIDSGQTRTASIGEMSHAGTFKDKGKEGISKAGRALQKHAVRENPSMPKPTGNIAEVNSQGQRILDEILNHPRKVISIEKPRSLDFEVIDVFIPGKYGARFTKDGKTMIGFLEPPRNI